MDFLTAACVDVLRTHPNGPIAIVGIHSPATGEATQLVRGKNLTSQNLRQALKHITTVFRYGTEDAEALVAALPACVAILDLCIIARTHDLRGALQSMDVEFERAQPADGWPRRSISTGMWALYEKEGMSAALSELLRDNRDNIESLSLLARQLTLRPS